jgi:hypothetical protein
MTHPDQTFGAESATMPRLDAATAPGLEIGLDDVLVALVTSWCSLGVLWYGTGPDASFSSFLLLHLAVVGVPALFFAMRAYRNGDLTIAVLLLLATATAGPIGAIGCACMAFALWCRLPAPTRLKNWYEYIAGVAARRRVARIHDEMVSGRLPTDPHAQVPRFAPILQGSSVETQQRVLGVVGRRYHPDLRPILRKALRNRNGFIRAQAAAIASRLDIEEKNRLWSTTPPADQGAPADALDVEARRP